MCPSPRSETTMGSPSSFKGSMSEATGSMRSPLSSFTRSPWISTSTMPSPVSSRLTMEFETAFSLEAEQPIRFSSTDILPYLSQPSRSCSSSSSDFDTESRSSASFCDFNDDSHRVTLGSLIGLPMDSFRHFGESLRFRATSGSSHRSSSTEAQDSSPERRSRTCSLLFDLLRCLQRTRADYVEHYKAPVARNNFNNLTSFTITEVSEEEERDSVSDVGPTVFENSVFVEQDTLGSRIYEFNPLYISDAISEADPREVLDVTTSLPRDPSQQAATNSQGDENANVIDHASDSCNSNSESGSRLSVEVELPVESRSHDPNCTPNFRSQPLSPIRTVLTSVCCQLGDFSDVEK